MGTQPYGTLTPSVHALADFAAFANLFQVNHLYNSANNLLDLVFSDDQLINLNIPDVPLVTLDKHHPAIRFNVNLNISSDNMHFDYLSYDFKQADYTAINEYLFSFMSNRYYMCLELDSSLEIFYKMVYTALEYYVPKRRCKNPRFPIWFSAQLKQLIVKKKMAHRLFKTSGLFADYVKFSQLRASCKRLSVFDYNAYLDRTQNNIKSDPKSFWRYINNKRGYNNLPDTMTLENIGSNDPNSIADLFAVFFFFLCYGPVTP